jgi:hypothetical protein
MAEHDQVLFGDETPELRVHCGVRRVISILRQVLDAEDVRITEEACPKPVLVSVIAEKMEVPVTTYDRYVIELNPRRKGELQIINKMRDCPSCNTWHEPGIKCWKDFSDGG